MADTVIQTINTGTGQRINLKMVDNGDGTYSVAAAIPAGVSLTSRNVTQSLTIANGQQLSGGYADLGGSSLVALAIPAGYIANNISIQAAKDKAAADAGTFADVYDSDGVAVTLQVGAGARVVSLVGSALQAVASLQYIKLKTVQAVAADRTIGIIAKG